MPDLFSQYAELFGKILQSARESRRVMQNTPCPNHESDGSLFYTFIFGRKIKVHQFMPKRPTSSTSIKTMVLSTQS
jgi:hypothetical protein